MSAAAPPSSDADLPYPGLRRRRALTVKPVRLILFALAYLIAYAYGNYSQTSASPLWFPDSVLLCALLLTPRREWWSFLVVAVPVRFLPLPYQTVPIWFLFATTANDLIKATVTAYLLRRLPNGSSHPETMSQFATFLGVAVFLVPSLSAVAGAASRHLLGYEYWASWYQWFLGDGLANVVLTPTLLYWSSARFRAIRTRRAELVVWLAGFAASLVLAFALARSVYAPIAFCIPVPFLIWAATRFGLIGASTPLSVIALAATVILNDNSPLFSMGFESHSLLFLQLFLFVIAVPMLALAILIEERSSAEKNLRLSEEKLRQNYEEVRYLAGKLITAQGDERKRIALELHDDVVQRLALLAIQIANLDESVPRDMTQAHRVLSELRQETDQAAFSLRELSHQLHSSALQYVGLPEALQGLCWTLSQRHQIAIRVEAEPLQRSSYDINLCLYRVAQEALSNIVKHSGARKVIVMLAQGANSVQMEIRDNGIGFDPEERSTGLGLISMRERVRLQNGAIQISSEESCGTTIRVQVPIKKGNASERIAESDFSQEGIG